MRISTSTLLITGLMLALSACVSTSLLEHWKDPGYAGPALHKVLVVSIQQDQGRRRLWEDAMVGAFAKRGIQAEASYQVFPDQPPAPSQLTAMATRDGFDGVAATHFVGASRRTYIDAYPGWGWGCCARPWGWGPYAGPGFVESDVRADFQTDVYTVDATGGKLVWSGVTRSLDPGSTKAVTDDISHVLVPQLVKEGILTGSRS
jgi:hypothetical protein